MQPIALRVDLLLLRGVLLLLQLLHLKLVFCLRDLRIQSIVNQAQITEVAIRRLAGCVQILAPDRGLVFHHLLRVV
ncbi:hypothetical protein D3C80_1600970 [compost metagenome]